MRGGFQRVVQSLPPAADAVSVRIKQMHGEALLR
jgi:hypothetical protein